MNGLVVNCPSVSELKNAILRAGIDVPDAELIRLKKLPKWQQEMFHEEDIQNARNGRFRWTPTQLFGLDSTGPGRRARNHAAEALRRLVNEGLAYTFRFDATDRVYAARVTRKGRAVAEKLDIES